MTGPGNRETPPEHPLDFNEARDLIQLALAHLLDEQHAEHFGAFCPVCGLVTATQRFVREWKLGGNTP